MGWDVKRFVDTERIVDDLLCSICTDVIQDPVQTPCDHSFCKPCIETWLESGNKTCPVDRIKLRKSELRTPHRITRQLLNNLIIRCKNYDVGCCLMSKFEDILHLIEHENNYCKAIQKRQTFRYGEVVHGVEKENAQLKQQIADLTKVVQDLLDDKSVSSYNIPIALDIPKNIPVNSNIESTLTAEVSRAHSPKFSPKFTPARNKSSTSHCNTTSVNTSNNKPGRLNGASALISQISNQALVPFKNCKLPPDNAILHGQLNDSMGHGKLWSVIAHTSDALDCTGLQEIPGKSNGEACWYSKDGKQHCTRNFSWIISTSNTEVISSNNKFDPPSNAIYRTTTHDSNGPYYSIIAKTVWGRIPGKANLRSAWYGYNGKEYQTTDFYWIVQTNRDRIQDVRDVLI